MEKLLEISNVFENEVLKLNSSSSYHYKTTDNKYKTAAYFLYHSPFCHCECFNKLEYNTYKIENIYKYVFDKLSKGEKITMNKFRKWIVENYENINKYYNSLKYT